MVENQCVLVVDRSEETHEVLETALASSGVQTYHARRARRGLEMADQIRPDLIVLDLELDEANPESVQIPFTRQSEQNEVPLVILGNAQRAKNGFSLGEFVRKPYDYGPLVRRIEELLVQSQRSRRHAA